MVGSTISHYRITAELGRGGMGVVYAADDLRLGRRVAIKLLPGSNLASEEDRARFYREAHACAQLNHPNVAVVHEIDDEHEQPFIVMELVEGETLASRLAAGPLPIPEAVAIAFQIADGLQAAHEKGIVHRDVKSGNVMLTPAGRVKVLDFGLAKLAEAVDLTRKGSTIGTVGYMSPEQLRGEAATWASDAWSFGVVLYEMVAGRRPFAGAYEAEISYRILQEPFTPLAEAAESSPPELGALVGTLLSKDAAGRGRSLADALSTLARLGGGSGVSGLSPDSGGAGATGPHPAAAGPTRPDSTSTGAHPTIAIRAGSRWTGIGAAAFVLAIAAIWMLARLGAKEETTGLVSDTSALEGIAVMPFVVRGDTSLNYLGEGIVTLLAAKIDGVADLRSADVRSVLGFVQREGIRQMDAEAGRRVARQFGASRFILGDIARVGGPIRLSATLYPADGQGRVDAEVTVASDSGLLGGIDELARKLIAGHLGDAATSAASLAALTSASFPALREFLRGEQARRDGRYTDSYAAFRRAVDLDSTFALAWNGLGDMAGWGTNPRSEAAPARRAALRLGERLPERIRRKMRAALAMGSGQAAEAGRLLLEVTRDYPDDADAWNELGDVVFHYHARLGRPVTDALPHFRKGLALDPRDGEYAGHLAYLEAEVGTFESLDALPALRRSTPFWSAYRMMSALSSDSISVRKSAVRAALDSSLAVVGSVTVLAAGSTSDFALLDTLLDLRLERARAAGEEAPAWRFQAAAVFSAAMGRYESMWEHLLAEARRDPDSTMPLGPLLDWMVVAPMPSGFEAVLRARFPALLQSEAAHPLTKGREEPLARWLDGLIAAQQGDLVTAEGRLRELDARAPTRDADSLIHAFARRLEGTLLERRGDVDGAIRAYEAALLLLPNSTRSRAGWLSPNSLRVKVALLLAVAGRRDEALRRLEVLGDGVLDSEHTGFETISWRGPMVFTRAEIYDEQGRADEAIEYYTRFLRIWVDPDPDGRPMVDRARMRLDQLLLTRAREGGG